MGRKKIQIKPITDEKVRKVTFNRRRNGILKKAYELSILCDTQVVVLMYDQKQMCHVYCSEEGANAPAHLMDKFIAKDFCTVDPIRNYDTSPDLQLDDPSQAVWRVSREKVAVVNTYTVVPATGTPHLPSSSSLSSSRPAGENDDDDDEADGSEQLSVKSSRTYHTKNGVAKFGAPDIYTPALTNEGVHSPTERSVSPDPRNGQLSPRRSPKQHPTGHLQPQPQQQQQRQQQQPRRQGLGIVGSGYTPLMRAGEHFTPILYPPQPRQDVGSYYWPSPELVGTDLYGAPSALYSSSAAAAQPGRPSMLPNTGIQYANRQLQTHILAPDQSYSQSGYVQQAAPLLMKKSPRKEQAHFNHYVYPPPAPAPSSQRGQAEYRVEDASQDEASSPLYIYHDPSSARSSPPLATSPRKRPGKSAATGTATTNTTSPARPALKKGAGRGQTITTTTKLTFFDETPGLLQQQQQQQQQSSWSGAGQERRVTRSQSRSPQLKAARPPALPLPDLSLAVLDRNDDDDDDGETDSDRGQRPATAVVMRTVAPMKLGVPMHLRGPSLLDEISFDPETGAPMMESSALASWLGGGAPDALLQQQQAAGHSRETSHVRGESVSQWLNMPGIPE